MARSAVGELEVKRQRKKKEWVKVAKLPCSLFIPQGRGRGCSGSVPLPRQLLHAFATCGRDVGRWFE
jgi:hypothetical protein